jgi:uncharacterized protein YqfA (UPF0365 family)
MTGILAAYFGYPFGAVWSNLIASAICAVLVWWRVRAKMIRHHADQMAQAAAHHRERAAQAAADHEDMKAHVAAVGTRVASAAVAVPQQLLDDIAKRGPRRNPGPGKGGAG